MNLTRLASSKIRSITRSLRQSPAVHSTQIPSCVDDVDGGHHLDMVNHGKRKLSWSFHCIPRSMWHIYVLLYSWWWWWGGGGRYTVKFTILGSNHLLWLPLLYVFIVVQVDGARKGGGGTKLNNCNCVHRQLWLILIRHYHRLLLLLLLQHQLQQYKTTLTPPKITRNYPRKGVF